MAEENPSQNARSEHEELHHLLPRFIEIERRDGNADEVYPELAAHIATCDLCQFTVSMVMADLPGFDAPPDSRLRAADLPFIRRPRGGTHTILPGSRKDSYSVHISFPLLPDLAVNEDVARSGATAELVVPAGGLSLGLCSLELEDGEIGVTLSLYQERDDAETGSYYVIVDLVGDLAPSTHDAVLMIGSHVYTAPMIDQIIEFLNVDLGDVPEQVVLILES